MVEFEPEAHALPKCFDHSTRKGEKTSKNKRKARCIQREHRQTNRQVGRWRDRQADGQLDRQIGSLFLFTLRRYQGQQRGEVGGRGARERVEDEDEKVDGSGHKEGRKGMGKSREEN